MGSLLVMKKLLRNYLLQNNDAVKDRYENLVAARNAVRPKAFNKECSHFTNSFTH